MTTHNREKGVGGSHPELLRMKDSFESGKLSRRDFMQGLMALGLSVTAAGALIAGSRDAAAQTPKRGGRVRFAWDQHGPADTLDPTLVTATIDYIRGRSYYNNLVRFNNDLSLGPDLAEEWSSNADATEFTFKLRKGVEFHDGKTFNADDVVYTLNRHLGEGSTSKAKALVNMVKEWQKVDDYTVKAVLAAPNADLPAVLGTFHFRIIQNGAEGNYFLKPAGTGPFKCREFTPGVRSVGVRNENYFVEGRPYLDEIETFAITDAVARVNALVSGDIDICGNLDPKAFEQVESTPGLAMHSVESGAYFDIVCMRDRAPGDNLDFVLALKYLQNRERIVKSVLKGQGTIGNDHPVSPAYPDHCTELPQRPFDPDQAKFHLQKSGITECEIEVAEVAPGLTDTCLLLQNEASKIGLKVNLKRVPSDGYWGSVWMNKPIMVASWNMRPTANIMLGLTAAPDAPWNESHTVIPRMGDLLGQARAELDPVKRHELFCEMQKIVSEEYGTIIPIHRNYVDGISQKVKDLTRVPLAATGGCEWPEMAWLDV